jgi:hypothetical protein
LFSKSKNKKDTQFMSEPAYTSKEFGSQVGDIEQFVGLIGEIKQHNEKNTLRAAVTAMFSQQVEVAGKTEELEAAGLPQEEAEEAARWLNDDSLTQQQMVDRMVLGVANGPVLEKAGLGLSLKRTDVHIPTTGGVESLGPVRTQVTDGARFVGFLNAAPDEAVDEVFKEAVQAVVHDAAQEAYTIIGDSEESDTGAIEVLGYADGISTAMERLGLPKDELLTRLSEYAKKGLVREYIQADKTGVFKAVDGEGYTPSTWHRDSTPGFLAGHWGAIIHAIETSKSNPNGAELTAELIRRANEHLFSARKDWSLRSEALKETNGHYGEAFNEIFDNVTTQLIELAEA